MMQTINNSPSMQFGKLKTGRIMLIVFAALLPGISITTWFFGWGLLINLMLASILAYSLEALALNIQKRPVKGSLSDNSALVTAVLFGITVPPGSSWWLILLGITFAILIAKHAYGGLGQNPFNPAMCGYLFLLLSFPLEMTSWQIPIDYINSSPLGWEGFKQNLQAVFPVLSSNIESAQITVDGKTIATPLITSKMVGTSAILEAQQSGLALFARTSETGWELINISYMLGGFALLSLRIISWHIPFSIIATLIITSYWLHSSSTSTIFVVTYLHLFGSATMIGAFFIATDPVSAATTTKGKILYGIVIGLGIYFIREENHHFGPVAIAILFGNFCAPLLDYYCRPQIYGNSKQKRFLWFLRNRS